MTLLPTNMIQTHGQLVEAPLAVLQDYSRMGLHDHMDAAGFVTTSKAECQYNPMGDLVMSGPLTMPGTWETTHGHELARARRIVASTLSSERAPCKSYKLWEHPFEQRYPPNMVPENRKRKRIQADCQLAQGGVPGPLPSGGWGNCVNMGRSISICSIYTSTFPT